MPVTWKINGSTPAALGLAGLRLTYQSLAPDVLEFTHLTAAWDADALFAYGTTITLTRNAGGVGDPDVKVFVGKVRTMPRFLGTQAESMTYQVLGPWDWLQRRALLQQVAYIADPTVSTTPTLTPQGLGILGQSDAGTSVDLSVSLSAVLGGVTDLTISVGSGFAYPTPWDEVADLTVADAIIRLLQTAPDAVTWFDYTTTPPTLHIDRRANLDAASLAVAPAGLGGTGSYAELESVEVTERPDLVPVGVKVIYRRIDSIQGVHYLRLITDTAGSGTAGDEGVIVRTIELAGLTASATVLEQKVRVTALSSYLTSSGTITSADTDAFAALSRFWKRKVGWLNMTGLTIDKFTACGRALTDVDDAGTLDTALSNELIEGAITPWMEDTTLTRKGQDQTYTTTVDVGLDGISWKKGVVLTAGVMATNCTSKTYRWTESGSYTNAEPTPTGVAAAIYDALSVLPVEGSARQIEQECTLTIRPGQVLNLTGGRTSWETMDALVQSTITEIDTGTTTITYGPPAQLGPQDLVALMRANRFKPNAQRGLLRTTGTA